MQIPLTLFVCWAGILFIGSLEAFIKKDFGKDATSFVTSVSTVTVTSTEKVTQYFFYYLFVKLTFF
jgi:hypothetical protein